MYKRCHSILCTSLHQQIALIHASRSTRMDPFPSGTLYRSRDPRTPAPLHTSTPTRPSHVNTSHDDATIVKPRARRQYDAIASPIFHGADESENTRVSYSFASFPPPAPSPPSTASTLAQHTRPSAPPMLYQPHASPASTTTRLLPSHDMTSPRPAAPHVSVSDSMYVVMYVMCRIVVLLCAGWHGCRCVMSCHVICHAIRHIWHVVMCACHVV